MKNPNQWAEEIASALQATGEIEPVADIVREIQTEAATIPGLYRCEQCGFHQSFNVLSAKTGGVHVDPTVRDFPCPNDGTLMMRLTWAEQCHGLGNTLMQALMREKAREDYFSQVFDDLTRCKQCEGTGIAGSLPCEKCNGEGHDHRGSALAVLFDIQRMARIHRQKQEQKPPENTAC